jgi:hypothetical protein
MAVVLLALCVISPSTASFAATPYTDAANKALGWVKTQQQPDGSFAGLGAGSTIDAVLAIIAAGHDPATYTQGGNTPITFLESKAAELSKAPGGAGKLLLLAATLGMDGTSFGGVNLVNLINGTYNAQTGQYGPDVIGHAFSMLGLSAAGQAVPPQAVVFLESAQGPEGGWAFSGDTGPGKADTNTTAVVLQALVAQSRNADTLISKAVAYLTTQQNPDGGFPFQQGSEYGSDSDVNSTSYVVQAAIAVGESDMATEGLDFIVSLQKPSGAFQWMRSDPEDNPGATYQAISALLGATLALPRPGVVSENPPSVEPGMPTTGHTDNSPIAALAALASLAIGAGLIARRNAISRQTP